MTDINQDLLYESEYARKLADAQTKSARANTRLALANAYKDILEKASNAAYDAEATPSVIMTLGGLRTTAHQSCRGAFHDARSAGAKLARIISEMKEGL